MKYLSILAFFVLFTATSCVDDVAPLGEISTVKMQTKATYDGDPLVMMEPYIYEDGLPVFFTKFKFFLSNISLVRNGGEIIELSEIEVVDFNESGSEGVTLSFSNIPVGEYTSLKMGIGVASDLNKTEPIDYSSSHPLSESTDYWSPWESYVFTKIEGKVDVAQDGTFEKGIVYHIGSDELFRTVSFNEPLVVGGAETVLPLIEIDLKKILVQSSGDYLDMEANATIHNEIELMEYLMDNFENAFLLQ